MYRALGGGFAIGNAPLHLWNERQRKVVLETSIRSAFIGIEGAWCLQTGMELGLDNLDILGSSFGRRHWGCFVDR